MNKLSLLLLLMAGTCVAQDRSTPNRYPPNSRMLLVFSPDSNNPGFIRQLELIQRHSFELSARNTVVVPVSTASRFGEEKCSFENLPISSVAEQDAARSRFHVGAGDFVVILVDEDGTQEIRSVTPVDIHSLVASLDAAAPRL